MNPIEETFRLQRRRGGKVLIPFLTGGFPNFDFCLKLALELARRGADILEIGVPFSDPIADGPIIQSSSHQALASGTNLKSILRLIQGIKGKSSLPVVLMSYYNPLFRWGIADFARSARRSGVDGLIIPDLPPEEAGEVIEACLRTELDPIFLIAPTSEPKRIRLISQVSRGYIYYVSVAGTTGMRRSLAADLEWGLSRIRRITRMPIAVGFGISTPPQAERVAKVADGVIIGSALISHMQRNLGRVDWIQETGEFFSKFRESLIPKGFQSSGS
ncbi:MAG: tryptophan synthase subunit alpha [candidate division NC10 bacterium]|nr:tryptophan synthase subunit alpha [candidate division NC10 bacterium]